MGWPLFNILDTSSTWPNKQVEITVNETIFTFSTYSSWAVLHFFSMYPRRKNTLLEINDLMVRQARVVNRNLQVHSVDHQDKCGRAKWKRSVPLASLPPLRCPSATASGVSGAAQWPKVSLGSFQVLMCATVSLWTEPSWKRESIALAEVKLPSFSKAENIYNV